MKKITIIIPAYNEELRIRHTLETYIAFFQEPEIVSQIACEFLIVLNGCVDNTLRVVQGMQKRFGIVEILDLKESGKGLAIKAGFMTALQKPTDIIGFVDADMATSPQAFYALITALDSYDGVIASRYMQGAQVYPPRPWIKRWGSWLFYESLIKLLFGLHYADFQCGAKIFRKKVVEVIAPHMVMTKWAFDVEILYLCKKFGFSIREVPTVWHDQAGSKLRISSGFRMLGSLVLLRLRHSPFSRLVK